MRDKELQTAVMGLIIVIALLIGLSYAMVSNGYHMEFSWINGRWIWVNQEGKP